MSRRTERAGEGGVRRGEVEGGYRRLGFSGFSGADNSSGSSSALEVAVTRRWVRASVARAGGRRRRVGLVSRVTLSKEVVVVTPNFENFANRSGARQTRAAAGMRRPPRVAALALAACVLTCCCSLAGGSESDEDAAADALLRELESSPTTPRPRGHPSEVVAQGLALRRPRRPRGRRPSRSTLAKVMARGGRARVEPRALLPRALGGHPGEHASHPPSGGHERQLQRLQLPRLRGPRGSSLHPAPGDISPASPEPFPASTSTGRAIPSPLAAPAAPPTPSCERSRGAASQPSPTSISSSLTRASDQSSRTSIATIIPSILSPSMPPVSPTRPPTRRTRPPRTRR